MRVNDQTKTAISFISFINSIPFNNNVGTLNFYLLNNLTTKEPPHAFAADA